MPTLTMVRSPFSFSSLFECVLTFVPFTAVQWFRQRFNECFDKADFAKTRCQDEIPESASFAEKLIYDRALELVRPPLLPLPSLAHRLLSTVPRRSSERAPRGVSH